MNNQKHYTTQTMSRKDFRFFGWGMFALGAFFGAVIVMIVVLFTSPAYAEDLTERRVICSPNGWVNIREKPKLSSAESGRLYLGDTVTTDGRKQNGFLHIVDVGTEAGEGWVFAAYMTDDELWIDETGATVARKNVRLRKAPGGEVIRMLRKGERLTVYAWTGLWAVTDKGFVQIEFLECDH